MLPSWRCLRTHWRIRLSRRRARSLTYLLFFARFDHSGQAIQKLALRGMNLLVRFWQGEPLRAIDLGKFLKFSGLRGPLHREEIAADRTGVTVALDRPGG